MSHYREYPLEASIGPREAYDIARILSWVGVKLRDGTSDAGSELDVGERQDIQMFCERMAATIRIPEPAPAEPSPGG